jgi:ABC-type oligopeptide transport system substrate-binding subunit
MKKKLAVLVLTLGSLVISAACASSGGSSQPKGVQTKPHGVQPDSGENWAKADATGFRTHTHAASLASR